MNKYVTHTNDIYPRSIGVIRDKLFCKHIGGFAYNFDVLDYSIEQ